MEEFGLIPHDHPAGLLVANAAASWQQISPLVPVCPTGPAHKPSAVLNWALMHSMESKRLSTWRKSC